MKNTNTKAFRETVLSYIVGSAYDCEDMGKSETVAQLFKRFESEYNYAANKARIPNNHARVAEWLSGLAINVACYYVDIIALAECWHECELNEKQRDKVCEDWFSFLALHLMRAWREQGLHV